MKTCEPHGYNPPSKCPNCSIHKRRKRKAASKKGWETRRANVINEVEEQENTRQKPEEFSIHGWMS
jgi:hypothetical protein